MGKSKTVTENRHKYIGGSDVPIIMGISPFKTRWQLLLEKAEPSKSIGKDLFTNDNIEYGNTMEPKIRDYISEVEDSEFVEKCFVFENKDESKLGIRCNVDGYGELDGQPAVLEIKTTSQIKNNIYDYKAYVAQLLFYMATTETKNGILAVYKRPEDFDETFDDSRLQIFYIDLEEFKNELLVEQIFFAVDKFNDDLIKVKDNPLITEEELQPNDVVDYAKSVILLEQQMRVYNQIKSEYDELMKKLKDAMQKNGVKKWITNDGTKITLVPDGEDKIVKEFDLEEFKEDYPELYEKYLHDKVKRSRSGYVRVSFNEYIY